MTLCPTSFVTLFTVFLLELLLSNPPSIDACRHLCEFCGVLSCHCGSIRDPGVEKCPRFGHAMTADAANVRRQDLDLSIPSQPKVLFSEQLP